jgi:crotonobetainyl-CoA:carnitine CoA-transferase CaiB-like acyl-CoA transferase
MVIEAARPRALLQLGIDAAHIVRTTPGLTWLTLTGHGAVGDASNAVGFGDDGGVAGGLSAALQDASGHSGFVGDAIADPLTGIYAANVAWKAWQSRRSGRFGIAMSRVIAEAIAWTRARDAQAFNTCLKTWSASVGQPFPAVARRAVGRVATFGEDTSTWCQSGTASC